jgi:flagellar hook assembly protein FlgD
MFEHNQKSSSLDVQITIFTITGKVIKTIRTQLDGNTGFAQTKIPWDGLDDFGSQIGRGVYIYNLKVKASNGLEAEKNEKLVILR